MSPNNSKRGVAGEVIKQRRENKIEKIFIFIFSKKINSIHIESNQFFYFISLLCFMNIAFCITAAAHTVQPVVVSGGPHLGFEVAGKKKFMDFEKNKNSTSG